MWLGDGVKKGNSSLLLQAGFLGSRWFSIQSNGMAQKHFLWFLREAIGPSSGISWPACDIAGITPASPLLDGEWICTEPKEPWQTNVAQCGNYWIKGLRENLQEIIVLIPKEVSSEFPHRPIWSFCVSLLRPNLLVSVGIVIRVAQCRWP